MHISWKLLLLTAAQAAVVIVFLKGFLLTRVELPDIAQCQGAGCSSQLPAYSKAVLLIVDAVRYDFLCGQQSHDEPPTASFMPKTLHWVQAGAGAAVASRFIADTPTITMSRLKALLTGGLPTFLDIGQSFSASAINEDNLLRQLLAQGKKLVMMGDDTWMQLAQDAFVEAYPYPSFNVHDLHTVDDGVWQHLVPLLTRPDSWDVLIAHYLGVDHAGHSFGVNSKQMQDKLAQMDDQVSTVIASLVSQAGPGGLYEDTLLLVLSDHGQTQGGDHGGGTPEETDSILVALSLRHMNNTLQQQQQPQQQQQQQGKEGQGQVAVLPNRPSAHMSSSAAQLLLRLMAAGTPQQQQQQHSSAVDDSSSTEALLQSLVCHNTVPQIDLTPLLAHLLGVTIPFGNLGKVPPHLFAALSRSSNSRSSAAAAAWLPQYAAALAANAAQVDSYLNRYAAVGGLPSDQLATVNQLYAALKQQQQQALQQQQHEEDGPVLDDATEQQEGTGNADSSSGSRRSAVARELEVLVMAQLSYLSAAADLARRRFTLFQQGPMWAGCGLAVLLLLGQLGYLRCAVRNTPPSPHPSVTAQDHISCGVFAALAAFHALGLFSVGLLMGEGRLTCVLLAALTLLLLRAALLAANQARHLAQGTSRQQLSEQAAAGVVVPDTNGSTTTTTTTIHPTSKPQQQQQLVQLVLPSAQYWVSWQPTHQSVKSVVALLVCNLALQLLGLIDRSGQDPHDKTQPTSDLLVGPDAAWQRAAFTGFTVGPLLVVWGVYAAISRTLCSSSAAGAPGHGQGREQQQQQPSGMRAAAGDVSSSRGIGAGGGSRVVSWLRGVCGVQLVCLAAFWLAQLYGYSDASLCGLVQAGWTVLLQSPVLGNTAASLAVLGQGGLLQQVAAVGIGLTHSSVCVLPLRLLLPRVVYVCAVAALGAAVLCALLPAVRQQTSSSSKQQGVAAAQQGRSGDVLVGEGGVVLLLWLCAVLAAPVVMVLGFKGPATLLLALLQAVGLCRLLWLQAAASAFVLQHQMTGSNSSGSNGSSGKARGLTSLESSKGSVGGIDTAAAAAAGDCYRSMLGAGAWSLMALQLFFCSGHFCEFSGLQYASAFIGFDDMVWYASGALLLLNTCGFLLLAPLTLPVLLACCRVSPPPHTQHNSVTVGSGPVNLGLRQGVPDDAGLRQGVYSSGPQGDGGPGVGGDGGGVEGSGVWGSVLLLRQQVECGLLVMNCVRFAALVVSLVSAAIQQQHILLWAIFAPKLVFELAFMVVTAAGQLLVAALLPHCV